MAETENVIRDEFSIQVDSTEGYRESILLEDIGGAMLLSLTGHQAPRGLENAPEVAATAFDRDTFKYDLGDWIKKRAKPELALDGQALSDETFHAINLLDTYRAGKQEVEALQSDKDMLSSPRGQLQAKTDAVTAYMQSALEKYGSDAIQRDQVLKNRILKESQELQDATTAEIDARIAELRDVINAKADELEATTGEGLTEFKESGTPAVKKLIAPIRELVRLELIAPGGNFEGLTGSSLTFGKYGPNAKKLAMYVPNKLNGAQIPMTYADAIAFADATYAAASKSASIFA